MKRLTWRLAALTLLLSAGVVRGDEAADLFNSLDKNQDGRLEKSEIGEEQMRHFERLLRAGDKNQDGILTKEEFGNAAKPDDTPKPGPGDERRGPGGPGGGPGGRPSPEEMFRRVDKDGNGKISRTEVQEASEMPEPVKAFLSRQFDELKKEEFSPEDMRPLLEGMRRAGGRSMIDRVRSFDRNGDGKLSREEIQEIPAEGRERLTQMMERTGRDEIDLKRMEELMAQGGPGGPEGPGGRRPEGNGRDGSRPEGGPRDGERRPEGGPRDGERRPDGGSRDGERRPGGGMRDGEQRSGMRPALIRALDADGDGKISKEELQNAAAQFDRLDRNGDGSIDLSEAFGPPPGGGRGPGSADGAGDRPRGDGDRPRPDGDRPRPDGDRPRPDGDRPRPDGDQPRQEGDRPRIEGNRPRPDGNRPRGEGAGDRGRPDGDRPSGDRPNGDRPMGDGNRPEGRGPGQGPGRGGFNPEEMFRRMDQDKDGFLSKEEAPPRMKENFDRLDKNGDGKLSPEELRDAIPRRPAGDAPKA